MPSVFSRADLRSLVPAGPKFVMVIRQVATLTPAVVEAGESPVAAELEAPWMIGQPLITRLRLCRAGHGLSSRSLPPGLKPLCEDGLVFTRRAEYVPVGDITRSCDDLQAQVGLLSPKMLGG